MLIMSSCPAHVKLLSVSAVILDAGAVGVIFMDAITSFRGCKVLGCFCGLGSMDLSNSFSSAASK